MGWYLSQQSDDIAC